MNAYDFDNTIYDGESIVDFFLFCLKKDLKLLRYLPIIMIYLIRYKLNIVSVEKIANVIEKFSVSFFKNSDLDYKTLVEQFWKKNIKKLKPEFLNKLKKDDLIITGCPEFLIDYIKPKLKTKNIIATIFNFETKKLEFLCLGENKVKIYKEKYNNKRIDKFYTDSLLDVPFMKLSNEAYIVRKNKVKLIDKTKID